MESLVVVLIVNAKKLDPKQNKCIICGGKMIDIQVCHLRCENCGAVLDCSDKGSFW